MNDSAEISEKSGLTSRSAALDLLALVELGRSLDDALDQCRSFNDLTGADRAFARALVSTVLRRRGSIDHIIGAFIDRPLPKKVRRVMDILRVTTAQILLLETPPHAAVSTAVELTKERQETGGYGGLVNAVTRKIAKTGPKTLAGLPPRTDSPGWLWRSWERAYGPRIAKAIADAHQQMPPLDLTMKDPASATSFAERLGGEVLPNGSVRLTGVHKVAELTGFNDGAWWVQDAAAALPVRLLGDVKDKRVADMCAAPGGKTLQLAAAGADVIAIDKSEYRLNRVTDNLERTNLTANIVAANALDWRPEKPLDAILLDAPCSATGTIRRHPDIPWTRSETDIDALAELQDKLINHALSLLAPGGLLVYCVCSLQQREAEERIDALLKRNDAVSREPVRAEEIGGIENAINRHGDLRTTPALLGEQGGMDGFFAARLRKSA